MFSENKLAGEEIIRRLIKELGIYLERFGGGPGIADVRAGLAKWGNGPLQTITPNDHPVCVHMDQALEAVRSNGEPTLAAAIQNIRPHLNWTVYNLYNREEIGADFADGHAFTTLIGEGGFVSAEDFDLGLFLIKPNTLYKDHHHAAPELYAPLTGPHGWRFNPHDNFEWRKAHTPIWNPPWQPHTTLTGEIPFLCIFCWTRDVNIPAKVIRVKSPFKGL